MKKITFAGSGDKVNLNFRNLPTPMVRWEGTAKQLHDLILESWLKEQGQPEAKEPPHAR